MPTLVHKLKRQQGNVLIITMALLLLAMAGSAIAGYYAVASRPETDIEKYHTLMNKMEATATAIGRKAAKLEPLGNLDRLRKRKSIQNLPELKLLVDRDSVLRLEGIVFQEGRPVALVNDRILQLHEEIGGYRIIHIGDSSVLFMDKAGKTREISIYEELKKYEGK